jgi:hypothetical protein
MALPILDCLVLLDFLVDERLLGLEDERCDLVREDLLELERVPLFRVVLY